MGGKTGGRGDPTLSTTPLPPLQAQTPHCSPTPSSPPRPSPHLPSSLTAHRRCSQISPVALVGSQEPAWQDPRTHPQTLTAHVSWEGIEAASTEKWGLGSLSCDLGDYSPAAFKCNLPSLPPPSPSLSLSLSTPTTLHPTPPTPPLGPPPGNPGANTHLAKPSLLS